MSLDAEGRGANCQQCGHFDFLPLVCQFCNQSFCTEHLSAHESCQSLTRVVAVEPSSLLSCQVQNVLTCSTCGLQDMCVTVCDVCRGAMCASHRFEHLHEVFRNAMRRQGPPSSFVSQQSATVLGPHTAGAKLASAQMIILNGTQLENWGSVSFAVGLSAGRLCDAVMNRVSSQPTAESETLATKTDATESFLCEIRSTATMVDRLPSWSFDDYFALNEIPKAVVMQDVAAATRIVSLLIVVNVPQALAKSRFADALSRNALLQKHFEWAAHTFRNGETQVGESRGVESQCTTGAAIRTDAPSPSAETFDDSEAPAFPFAAASELLSLPFATTKTTPRGAKVKGAKECVAVLMSPRLLFSGSGTSTRACWFVLAVDPMWSVGKLLDRIMDESFAGKPQLGVTCDVLNLETLCPVGGVDMSTPNGLTTGSAIFVYQRASPEKRRIPASVVKALVSCGHHNKKDLKMIQVKQCCLM